MTEKVISFFEPGDIKRKRKNHEEYNRALLEMDSGVISPSDYYEKCRELRKAMERLSFEKQKWINEATPLWCNEVIIHECYKYNNNTTGYNDFISFHCSFPPVYMLVD